MNEKFLAPEFAAAWQNLDPFDAIEESAGEMFREVKSRRTFRFELNGSAYFAKVHYGAGWREIFKNLTSLKIPVLGARNEYHAIRALEKIHVGTMDCRAYAQKGCDPARLRSFIVTAELKNMVSLEEFCQDSRGKFVDPALQKELATALGECVGKMHSAGINHRDCYLCHFMFDPAQRPVKLHVIDLHRAQMRDAVPYHYRVKDLGGIIFSGMEAGLGKNDAENFFNGYFSTAPEAAKISQLHDDVMQNARTLYATAKRG